MIELLHYIISSIVSDEEAVKISLEEDNGRVTLNLDVPQEVRGTVIGKNGMNIKAIRNLVSIIARREDKKIFIKIVD